MVNVAVLDDYQDVARTMADWSAIPKSVRVQFFHDHISGVDALVSRLRDFEVICAMRERTAFGADLLERLPNLRLLITTGARNASIDDAACTRLGIVLSGTGNIGISTAELTWGLILAVTRRIPAEDAALREGKWQTGIGPMLGGKTLGVLGLGRLGAPVAAVGKAFGMRLIAWSQNMSAARAAECGATLVTKEELFAQSDVITIHLVLSDRTRGLIGARELALMKPAAYLVNTSRGPIVDEAALVEALRSRRIAGAALDVFAQEPLPANHPFLRLDNTVLTPHIGYVVNEAYAIFYQDTVENIASYLSGKPVRVLNPDVLTKTRPKPA
jgi:phosphoglycerate dehydrogenase-like enzyme